MYVRKTYNFVREMWTLLQEVIGKSDTVCSVATSVRAAAADMQADSASCEELEEEEEEKLDIGLV